jgi:acetoin utilization deacetylase AcuC-like enzyme
MLRGLDVMLIIFSELQYNHKPAYIIKLGERRPSYDVPERIDSILLAINKSNLGQVIEPEDAGIDAINTVHDEGMIQFLNNAHFRHRAEEELSSPVFPSYFPPPGQRARPNSFEGQKGFYCTDLEVPIDGNTWDAAIASVNCAYTGAMRLRSGEKYVYALCRPPGHHAGHDFFGGYCYLNNAAVAAKALSGDNSRSAIIDIDYHHGNGTQAIFYESSEIFYGSLHIDPSIAYPFFAGYSDEEGIAAGEGANCNIPLQPGTDDMQYISALKTLLDHIAAFAPVWLIVSAGFDTYIKDPISKFRITNSCFEEIGRCIRALNIPTLVIQEGGYCISDLGMNVVTFLHGISQ